MFVVSASGCSGGDRATVEAQARSDLASTIRIVTRARTLHQHGSLPTAYVRVVERQNADDALAAAVRLERAGAMELGRRARELGVILRDLANGDANDAPARLDRLRPALDAHGSG